MTYVSIKNWPVNDKPREKLLDLGARSLSEAELIAILLGSGTQEISAVELARTILAKVSNNLDQLGKLTVDDLKKIRGIGEAKAITILASLELGRRRNASNAVKRQKITSSQQAYSHFQSTLSDLHHEEFWASYLNRSNTLIEKVQISQGGIAGTVTDIRILMRKALDLRASSIIICHNHPSGNLTASRQDINLTTKIKEAAKLFDINLLDHIIIGNNGKYLSFADEGII